MMELSDVIKLIDDVEDYSKRNIDNNDGTLRQDLSERIIDFEKFLQTVGLEDENDVPDTVEEMRNYLLHEPSSVFRWIKELGIKYFDWQRMCEKAS